MKKIIALVLALMLFMLAGCGNDEALAAKQAEVDELKAQLSAMENAPGAPTVHQIHAVNATVEGKTTVDFTEAGSFTATAVLEAGQVVDHWVLNGEVQAAPAAESFTFNAGGDTVVVAVIRAEKKLTTINAEIRFLNADKAAAGEALTEFVFEKDYVNPVTGENCEGGKISAEIKAVIPAGKTVDYWLINGVPYYYNTGIISFVVEDLDEATTYEVVLKDLPITYYKVTCRFCTFNGNVTGYVPAGMTVTFIADGSSSADARFYVNGALVAEYVKSITLQINSDTYVEAYAIIN